MTASRSAGESALLCGALTCLPHRRVYMLPGALKERCAECATEFAASNLLGTGQFCTNPGIVILQAGPETEAFIADVKAAFQAAPGASEMHRPRPGWSQRLR